MSEDEELEAIAETERNLSIGELLGARDELLEACKAALECITPTGRDTKSDRAIVQIQTAIDKWHTPIDKEVKLSAMTEQRDELLAALKALFRAIENGELVRDTSKDHESDWALRMIRLTNDLSLALQAIDKAEKGTQ